MPKALRDVTISFFFFCLEFMLLLLIAFIISIETEASLLALAKSIYHWICGASKKKVEFKDLREPVIQILEGFIL